MGTEQELAAVSQNGPGTSQQARFPWPGLLALLSLVALENPVMDYMGVPESEWLRALIVGLIAAVGSTCYLGLYWLFGQSVARMWLWTIGVSGTTLAVVKFVVFAGTPGCASVAEVWSKWLEHGLEPNQCLWGHSVRFWLRIAQLLAVVAGAIGLAAEAAGRKRILAFARWCSRLQERFEKFKGSKPYYYLIMSISGVVFVAALIYSYYPIFKEANIKDLHVVSGLLSLLPPFSSPIEFIGSVIGLVIFVVIFAAIIAIMLSLMIGVYGLFFFLTILWVALWVYFLLAIPIGLANVMGLVLYRENIDKWLRIACPALLAIAALLQFLAI